MLCTGGLLNWYYTITEQLACVLIWDDGQLVLGKMMNEDEDDNGVSDGLDEEMIETAKMSWLRRR